MKQQTKAPRIIGAFLLFVSAMIAFAWFIWLAPVKRINSENWWKHHSNLAIWEEEQKSVFRAGVTHDVGISIGRWGDKDWATWIVNHIQPGQEIGNCESGHLGEALAEITNHQLEPVADVWLAWWQTNQTKSQVEWIREGFAEKGIILHEPLTTNNMIDLLLLSRLSTNSQIYANTPSSLRGGLRMNAFRWLRDSGVSRWDLFSIWNSDVNAIPETDRNRIVSALLDYTDWYGQHWNDPNKLAITPQSERDPYSSNLFFMKTGFHWIVYSLIAALAFAGVCLLRHHPPK
jgi:hypothetical protein